MHASEGVSGGARQRRDKTASLKRKYYETQIHAHAQTQTVSTEKHVFLTELQGSTE